jgi:hypothetical protein
VFPAQLSVLDRRDRGVRWPPRLVATASENRLTDHQSNGAMDFLHQASAEHFQQSAEFLPLRNRDLGTLAIPVLLIPLARRAATTTCAAVQATAPLFRRW